MVVSSGVSVRGPRAVAGVLALSLVLAACSGSEPGPSTSSPSPSPSPTAATGVGVTEEPCPDAVDPSKGCIYLGVASDLSDGPFRVYGPTVTAGQEAFWRRVNENGGIGGYEIDIATYTRDHHDDPEAYLAALEEIEPHVLAIAQVLGSAPALAGQAFLDEHALLAVPASWWSGWEFDDSMLPSGEPTCLGAINGLDWASEQGPIETVMAIHYPGPYGGDAATGVSYWAGQHGIAFDPSTHAFETAPNTVVDNQDEAVARLLEVDPDVVLVSTGPQEAGEIVGKAVLEGFEGLVLGSAPTFLAGLLDAPQVAEAMTTQYREIAPWGQWGSGSDAHQAIADALKGQLPANDGFTSGWIWSYPLAAVLEAAAEAGDLTREGLQAVLPDVVVDYEGALPDRGYGGAPNDDVAREARILAPDADAPMGLRPLAGPFTGPTVEQFGLATPCWVPAS